MTGAEKAAAYRKRHPDRVVAGRKRNNVQRREYNKLYRQKNPANRMLYSARSRAIVKGWDCDIELEDIVIPERCPVLGIPLVAGTNGKDKFATMSLDRIDSSKGYVKGNVRVISTRANLLKSDATLAELVLLAKDAKALAGIPEDE